MDATGYLSLDASGTAAVQWQILTLAEGSPCGKDRKPAVEAV
jgi:hypothetical protein